MKHRWVGTRNLYHTSWTNNGGGAYQAEGTANAKTNTVTTLVFSRNWKKADTAESKGDSGRRQGQKGRQGLYKTVKGLHAVPVQ